MCYGLINSAIVDNDKQFFNTELFKQMSNSIEIDPNKLSIKIQPTIKWIDNLERRLIIDGY